MTDADPESTEDFTKVLITDMASEFFIDVEISPAIDAKGVAFLLDERENLVQTTIVNSDDSMTNATVDADAFWAAIAALTRDNINLELEEMLNDSSDE